MDKIVDDRFLAMPSDIDILRQKLAADPLDISAFSALRNFYMKNGMLHELAELLESRAVNLGAQAEAADLFHRAGELWLDKLGDGGRGTATLLRALEVAPNHRGSAERLERIYRESGNYEALLQILTRWVEGLENYEPGRESATLRSSLYQQIGEVWASYYQRQDVAVSFYKRATQADPTNVMAIYLAREIYMSAGNADTAARLYEMEISAEPDPARKVALHRELAILRERELGDLDGAVVTLRRAQSFAPTDPDILYEMGTAIMRRIEAGQEGAEDRKLAADAFQRLAQLSDPDMATQYLETALDLVPTHEGCIEEYERHCALSGAWDDFRLRLERCLDGVDDETLRVPIVRRLGRLHVDRLGDAGQALGYFERLEEFGNPADLDMLRQLRGEAPGAPRPAPRPAPPTVEEEREDTEEAIPVVAGAPAEAAPPPPEPPAPEPEAPAPAAPPATEEPELPPVDEEALKRLRSDAQKLQKLGMVEKAEAKMIQVIEMAPEDSTAWAFLERRYRSTNRFKELRDLLLSTSDSPRLPRDAKLQRLREAAALSETRLRDADASVEIYRRMVSLDPENQDARKAFERILTTGKKWEEFVAYLEEDLYRVADPDAQIDLCQKIADIHLLRRDDPRAAYDIWWRAYELKPDDDAILAKLEELALRMRDWAEMDRVLRLKLDKTLDPGDRLAVFLRLVEMEEESLEDPAAAAATARECFAEFPDDLTNLRRLVRLEEASGEPKTLIEAITRLNEISDDKAEKNASLKKMALYNWEMADNRELACACWEKYIASVPGDLEAYEKYGEILASQGREEDLIALYRKLLADRSLADHHRAFMRRLGLLLSSEKVNRRDEAMDVWRRLLEGGDDIEALRTLASWDEEKERWPDLRDNLRRQASLASSPDEKAEILRRLADILYERLHEPRNAIGVLAEILDVLPEDRSTLTLLRVINADIEDFRQAALTLERELKLPMSPDEEKPLLLVLASWYHEKLEDIPGAIGAYERILALSPGEFQAMSALEDLYEKQGEWEKLLRLIRSKTKAEEDEAEKLGLLLKGAEICEEKLGDATRAWSWFKEIYSRITIDDDVMGVVEAAGGRLAQWADLAAMYEDLAPHAPDTDAKVKRWRQAADLYFEKLSDHTRALYAINQAVIANPDEVALLDEADRAAVGCKDWERLGGIYERISRGIDDMEGRVMLLKRFSEVVWRKGGFAAGAVMPLLRAVEEMPGDAELFEQFHEAALEAGEYQELLGAFEKKFRTSSDNEERIEIKLRMARIMAEHLKNVDGAIKIIQEAIEVDPASERFGKLIFDAARGVEENLADRDKGYVYTWLLKAYQSHAESYEASDPFRVQFLRQIARLYRDGLRDGASAFNVLREAHRLTPTDLVLLEGLESLAGQEGFWEALADHLSGILRLSLKMETAQMVHDRRARILAEELARPEEAADHYWQLIQMNPGHPTAFRKLSDFYRSVGRYNDLLVILESAIERTDEQEQKLNLLRETARVWDRDLNNRFEALDAYRKILASIPDDAEAVEAVERLQSSKLGLASRLGGEEEEEEEEVDVEALRKSLLEEDLSGITSPSKPPPAPRSDSLPDWEDAVDTGEVPLQKVSQLLALTREPDEGGTSIEEGSPDELPAPQEAPPPADEPKPEEMPAPEAAAEAPPEPAPAPEEPAKPAPEVEQAGAAYVLDDASLGEVLEEEYSVDEFGSAARPGTPSSPPPLPAGARGKGDSLPPPPPPVRKRGQMLTPPPRPPRKKKR